MADMPNTPASAPAEAQSTENKNLQSTGAPSGSSAKSGSSMQKAVNEALNTLPGDNSPDVDVEDDGSDLTDDAQQKVEQKFRKKLKVGGKEVEVDEDELVKRAQMGYSAEEKWQEAAKMRKQVDSFIAMLQKDPASALEKMGFDVDALAEARIQQRIEEMQKSPEQLELEKIRRENEEIKADREREKQEVHEREMQRMQDQFATEIESDISEAMDAPDFGLPNSPYFVKRIADVMISGLKRGKEISARQAASVVRDEVNTELQQMYSASPDEVFERLIGKDRLNKYRRSKIKPKSKQQTSGLMDVKATGQKEIQQAQSNQAEKPKIRARDFFKGLGSK